MNQVRYRRVATNDDAEDHDEELKKKRRAELVEKIVTKIQALFWIAASCVLIMYTNLPKVVLGGDRRVNRIFLNIAIVCLCVNSVIMAYLTIWVPYQERVLSKRLGKPTRLDWEVYCPRMIPTMTAFGLLFFFTAAKAIWPVYGFLTPFILLVLFVGFIFLTHFIPWVG